MADGCFAPLCVGRVVGNHRSRNTGNRPGSAPTANAPRSPKNTPDHFLADDSRALAAYARGVNRFIETHRRNLPVEFTILGYRPATVDGRRLHGDRPADVPRPDDLMEGRLIRAAMYPAAAIRSSCRQLFPPRTGLEIQPGSNAWADQRRNTPRAASRSSPTIRTSNGACPPPGTWCISKLPDFNVSGVSLPGVPAIIIGHNERIAWGVTNLHFDVQDFYVERMEPQTGQYLFAGKVELARIETRTDPRQRRAAGGVHESRHPPRSASGRQAAQAPSRCGGRPRSRHVRVSIHPDSTRPGTGMSFEQALRRFLVPARTSFTPTWMATSVIRRPGLFRFAAASAARPGRRIAAGRSNGKGTSRSTNCRSVSTRRTAGSSPPIRTRFPRTGNIRSPASSIPVTVRARSAPCCGPAGVEAGGHARGTEGRVLGVPSFHCTRGGEGEGRRSRSRRRSSANGTDRLTRNWPRR